MEERKEKKRSEGARLPEPSPTKHRQNTGEKERCWGRGRRRKQPKFSSSASRPRENPLQAGRIRLDRKIRRALGGSLGNSIKPS